MFYRHLNADQLDAFEHSLDSIEAIYGRQNIFAADNLITVDRNLGFGDDPEFFRAFSAEASTVIEKGAIWRLHVLCWAGKHALELDGDFVECGVYEGFSSAVLTRYLNFGPCPKILWLYDLFDHGAETSGRLMPSHGRGLLARVARRFSDYPNVRLRPGLIPDSFATGLPDRIAWFHLDLNDAGAETKALDALFDRMVPGALLILDDYGWKTYPGQKAAADAFARSRGHYILELPTGQGLLIKR